MSFPSFKIPGFKFSDEKGKLKNSEDEESGLSGVPAPSQTQSPQVPSSSPGTLVNGGDPAGVPADRMSASDAKEFISGLRGSKVTLDQNIRELNVIDDNLGMKTEVNDPVVLTIWEIVGMRAEAKGYHRVAKIYRDYAKNFRVNMVAFDRKGRTGTEEIYTARMEHENAQLGINELDGKEKLLGRRSR